MRSTFAVCLLLLVIALSLAIGGCMSKAKRHLYKAEDMFENHDLEGAKKELQEAVKLNANLLDAQKSLAHIAEALGDHELAAQAYGAVSRLDPTDVESRAKARAHKQMRELEKSVDKAVEDVKAGQVDDGINTLREVVDQNKSQWARDKAIAALLRSTVSIAEQGYALTRFAPALREPYQQKRYQDAIYLYTQGLKAYLLIAEASRSQRLDPGADWFMRSINEAARDSNNPESSLRILSDVVAADPENKVANTELAHACIAKKPPDYGTAADLLERAGAPSAQIYALRAKANSSRRADIVKPFGGSK
jgi:tetratricopeptide (TPR) repeat protein